MAEETLLKIDRVTKKYGLGEITVEALKETSLEIKKGQMVVILGPSGSGKSTLLNIMGGMDKPTTGRIIFRGEDLSRADEARLTRYRREDLGFVFQFYNLIPDLTAKENVELAGNLVANPLPVSEVFQEIGLKERENHFPAQLSGGEQQRVSIARAAVKQPRLLLCDEPTGALDQETGKMILSLLLKINQKQQSTVVVVTHNTAIAAMARRLIRMSSGRIIEDRENLNPLPPERIDW